MSPMSYDVPSLPHSQPPRLQCSLHLKINEVFLKKQDLAVLQCLGKSKGWESWSQ